MLCTLSTNSFSQTRHGGGSAQLGERVFPAHLLKIFVGLPLTAAVLSSFSSSFSFSLPFPPPPLCYPPRPNLFRRHHAQDPRSLSPISSMIAFAFLQSQRLKKAKGEKRMAGPPPQPTLPAIRNAMLLTLAQPPPSKCPHCLKSLMIKYLPT